MQVWGWVARSYMIHSKIPPFGLSCGKLCTNCTKGRMLYPTHSLSPSTWNVDFNPFIIWKLHKFSFTLHLPSVRCTAVLDDYAQSLHVVCGPEIATALNRSWWELCTWVGSLRSVSVTDRRASVPSYCTNYSMSIFGCRSIIKRNACTFF